MKKLPIWLISVSCLVLAGYIYYKNIVVPNRIKHRVSYVASGTDRKVLGGKSNVFMFFVRYGDADGQSVSYQYYLNEDGSYRKRNVVYCLKEGAFEKRDDEPLRKEEKPCAFISEDARTADEVILGFPTTKMVQYEPLENGSRTVTNWISPNLNAIVKYIKTDTVTGATYIFEINSVVLQDNDSAIFKLPIQ